MEHTKGKLILKQSHTYSNRINVCTIDNDVVFTIESTANIGKEQSKDNANLIIDAFNTTNESGLTPSQLYKQNQELLEALKSTKSKIGELFTKGVDPAKINGEVFEMLQQAINNAKTKS